MMSSSSSNKVKLPASLARVGKELQVDVYAENGILLLKKGHYVLSGELRDKLVSLGSGDADAVEARLERERRERAAARDAEETASKVNPLTELEFLARRVQNLLRHVLAVPGFGDSIDEIATSLIKQAEWHPDGLIAAALLLPYKDYGSSHSLHIAALLAVLGRRLGISQIDQHSLICAALTMNIAIIDLQRQLAGNGGESELLSEQHELLLAHPILASAILREAGIEDERWHSIVQSHHEEWDGSGYPMGLPKEEIDQLAHLLHLVDVLTALLANAGTGQSQLPAIVLARLFKGEIGQFDPQYIKLIIKEFGIYPPGSFVKLANNEIAVVTYRQEKANEPKVASLRKIDGPPYAAPLLRDTHNPIYKVVEAVPASIANVRIGFLSKLWGY